MAKGTASALATVSGFPTASVNTNRSVSTRLDQWMTVKSWYALFSENNRSTPDGHLKPAYFRPDPEARGFSVDRVRLMGSEPLMSSKRTDARYSGYLQFIATCAMDVRGLLDSGKRLFCVYDSGTVVNRFHADICQNVHVEPGVQNRKARMMEIAWQLRSAFSPPQSGPPTSLP